MSVNAPTAPELVSFFKNLQAGQKQSVVVYGTSLSHTSAWPRALQEYFDTHFPGLVTFVNSAQSGQHSNWGLANLQERVLAHQPDVVFLEFSANDAATKHGISLEKSAANLDEMVSALRQQNPRVSIVLQTMSQCWDSPDEPMGKKSASDRPHLEEYYSVYRRYAREQALPLLDHNLDWLNLQRQDEAKFKRWLPDGAHPASEASLAVTWRSVHALLEIARRLAGG